MDEVSLEAQEAVGGEIPDALENPGDTSTPSMQRSNEPILLYFLIRKNEARFSMREMGRQQVLYLTVSDFSAKRISLGYES